MRKKANFVIISILILTIMAGIFWIYSKKKPEPEGEFLGEVGESIRAPAVAGAFYPGEPKILSQKIDQFLKDSPLVESEGALRILIVPHAGYEYSGKIAAFGFKQLENQDYSTVVIIGNSHQAHFDEAAIDISNFWETPLGRVKLDSELAQKLIKANPKIVENSLVHKGEHSLEVELPFLQKVLFNFKIVPILLGDRSKGLAEAVAQALAQNIDGSTLVVVSTDLSHYPPYEEANNVDQKTIEAVLTGSIEKLEATIADSMSKNIPNLATCMCGEGAVKAGMLLAKKLGEGEWESLHYANSGDIVGGDKSRAVGYAAIGLYSSPPRSSGLQSALSSKELNKEEQQELLGISRETLESYIKERKTPGVSVKHPKLNEKLGAFVTLRKNGKLRGCIGRFEPDEPLWKVVQEMTIATATEDQRFAPVEAYELNEIKIEVSVLSPLQKIGSPYRVKLGEHGVELRRGNRHGVFLPQVALETGWDFETFLGQLCSQKVGLSWDCWKDPATEIFIFTAQVFEEEGRTK